MYIYFVIAGLATIFCLIVQNKNTKVSFSKYRFDIDTFFACFLLFVLFILSSVRYGIGTDYYNYLYRYNSTEWINSYEWFFKCLIILSRTIGFDFQEFLTLINLFVYIGLYFTVNHMAQKGYRTFTVTLYIIYNFFGASFNYIRQFPAIILCFLLVFYLSNKSKNDIKSVKFFAFAVSIACLAFGFHKTVLFAFVVILLAKSKIINKNTIKFITPIFFICYFLTPYLGAGDLVNNLMASMGATVNEISWGIRLTNQGSSLVNRVLFWPIVLIITSMYKNEDETLKNDNKIIVLNITYIFYLIIGLNIGSEMIDRVLMYIYIFNILSFPLILDYVRNKWGRVVYRIMILAFISIGWFILIRNMIGNVYEIVPYTTIFR